MPNFNKLIYAGHLTRDVALKYLPNNTACAEFCLAANRKWKDQSGNDHEEVCYLDFACFGKQAELVNEYCRKGSAVLVTGRMKYGVWDGNDGKKHSKISVVCEEIQFLTKCGKQTQGAGDGPAPENQEGYEPGQCDENGVPF